MQQRRHGETRLAPELVRGLDLGADGCGAFPDHRQGRGEERADMDDIVEKGFETLLSPTGDQVKVLVRAY